LKWSRVSGVILGAVLLGACSSGWNPLSQDAAANNQMMLVRKDPASFGYDRLQVKSQIYPDLAVFLDQTGLPDFYAETNSHDRQYLIFYYLEKHHAFACRTRSTRGNEVEFTGPYRITDSEYRLLSGAKKEANQRQKALLSQRVGAS